jgi:hypothetical protein
MGTRACHKQFWDFVRRFDLDDPLDENGEIVSDNAVKYAYSKARVMFLEEPWIPSHSTDKESRNGDPIMWQIYDILTLPDYYQGVSRRICDRARQAATASYTLKDKAEMVANMVFASWRLEHRVKRPLRIWREALAFMREVNPKDYPDRDVLACAAQILRDRGMKVKF